MNVDVGGVSARCSGEIALEAHSALVRLVERLQESDFRGWDPYDALRSPILRTLSISPLLRRVSIQSMKRMPVNLRPMLGIAQTRHTKALALSVFAFARLSEEGSEPRYAALAAELADDLTARAIDDGAGRLGWGYDFDVQTRWGYYRQGEPNAVATAFGLRALLELERVLPAQMRASIVERVVAFALERLLVCPGSECFFAYYPGSTTAVHNANVLVADVVRRAGGMAGARAAADAALAFTALRQRPDGSWPYGEDPSLSWVDGFHTAYVLESLHASDGGVSWSDAVKRGLDLYLARLVDLDGAARATLAQRYPVDVHALSSGIACLSDLTSIDERCLPTAERMLRFALGVMRRRDGGYAFQRHRFWRNSTPYVRWNDAHMLAALVRYLVPAR